MRGLSEPAAKIIEPFSHLNVLRDYQLIGGTALAIKIHHRLSEDLDFCQWVPKITSAKYGVNAKDIHKELKTLFGDVDINHLGFSQVNYYIKNPGVKITFYHTDLKKPSDSPTELIGNINVAALEVLGGSKIYVTTQRREIRDYYDIYVLIDKNHLTLGKMLAKASLLSRETTPKKVHKILRKISFSAEEITRLQELDPVYPVNQTTLNDFFRQLAVEIETDHLISKP